MKVLRGNVFFSKSRKETVALEDGYIAVENGIVEGVFETLPEKYQGAEIEDYRESVIIPAFSDLHVHAPQYPQRGLAMDRLLYEWLNDYTFPLEAKYRDLSFAMQVYDAFAADLIANGTLHACIFGTIHPEATGYLLELL